MGHLGDLSNLPFLFTGSPRRRVEYQATYSLDGSVINSSSCWIMLLGVIFVSLLKQKMIVSSPNTLPLLQLVAQGIIATFKAYYP
jgi:hypothetical protein